MNFVAQLIVACEIAFWIVILLGWVIRYVFALAAVYLGVSIFGKSMIEWADERFRYYVTKEGPALIAHVFTKRPRQDYVFTTLWILNDKKPNPSVFLARNYAYALPQTRPLAE